MEHLDISRARPRLNIGDVSNEPYPRLISTKITQPEGLPFLVRTTEDPPPTSTSTSISRSPNAGQPRAVTKSASERDTGTNNADPNDLERHREPVSIFRPPHLDLTEIVLQMLNQPGHYSPNLASLLPAERLHPGHSSTTPTSADHAERSGQFKSATASTQPTHQHPPHRTSAQAPPNPARTRSELPPPRSEPTTRSAQFAHPVDTTPGRARTDKATTQANDPQPSPPPTAARCSRSDPVVSGNQGQHGNSPPSPRSQRGLATQTARAERTQPESQRQPKTPRSSSKPRAAKALPEPHAEP